MRGERFPLLLHSRRPRSLDEALDLARIWLSVASSWACWAPASAAIRFHSTGKKGHEFPHVLGLRRLARIDRSLFSQGSNRLLGWAKILFQQRQGAVRGHRFAKMIALAVLAPFQG